MAFSQQLPKDNPARRNAPAIPDTILTRRDGTLIGPELPRNKAWSAQTREWWDMWRRHEIAPKLEPSDWMHLLDTALLHSAYWDGSLKPSEMISSAAEIRRRVAAFGATLEDRLKLRIKFAESGKKDEAGTPKQNSVDYSSLVED
jgi:hypothetical protein